jgi:hypothetical protein
MLFPIVINMYAREIGTGNLSGLTGKHAVLGITSPKGIHEHLREPEMISKYGKKEPARKSSGNNLQGRQKSNLICMFPIT